MSEIVREVKHAGDASNESWACRSAADLTEIERQSPSKTGSGQAASTATDGTPRVVRGQAGRGLLMIAVVRGGRAAVAEGSLEQPAVLARVALIHVVSEYGPEALGRPALVSNLVKDLLPDSPAVGRLIVAAAELGVAEDLTDYTSQGLDGQTAVRLVASSFETATMVAAEVCEWLTEAFAIALGLTTADAALGDDSAASAPAAREDGTQQRARSAGDRTPLAARPELTERVDPPTLDAPASGEHPPQDNSGPGGVRRAGTLSGLPVLLAVAFARSGRTMAASAYDRSKDHSVVLWNVADLHHPRQGTELAHQSGLLSAMAFSPDGQTIVTAAPPPRTTGGTSRDHELIIWSARDYARAFATAAVTAPGTVTGIAFTPDGQTMATSGDQITIWSLARPARLRRSSPQPVSAISNRSGPLAFSPSGRVLAVCDLSAEEITVTAWDLWSHADPVPVCVIGGFTQPISEIHFPSEDQILVITTTQVSHWNISDKAYPPRRIATFGDHDSAAAVSAISPSGRIVAVRSGTKAGNLTLHDITTLTRPRTLSVLTSLHSTAPIGFTSDGRVLATPGGVAGSLILWTLDEAP